ncbi:MAG: hypothetical protein JRI76_07110 [Deltaproteobacteria bacterium]|nr:hypothetical protein [Deltaproteobacteria bacterium]MBW2041789.1 hypothetical protein [Deltaproteobacteria bacterium]MBW2132410.1 hypothetical protein [Deltaproteobacteria bacterium]
MALPPESTLLNGIKRMTCPVVITRHGGLDGVAIQKEEYRTLLNNLGIHLHVVAGREDSPFDPSLRSGQVCTLVPELDFFHPHSLLLYKNAFKNGPERGGIESISRSEWEALFLYHKTRIKEHVDRVLANVTGNTPVIVYNLLSLRHFHPAAAVAVKELVEKYPKRVFLSHSADPDAERPERISRLKDHVRQRISADSSDRPYSGGPYHRRNLYHIVLNPTQRENFIHAYGIPENHVFEIPDFSEFPFEDKKRGKEPSSEYIDFLFQNCVRFQSGAYYYERQSIQKEAIFFLSPVRPVARKRLKEAMLLAWLYGVHRKKAVAFIVTHPDIDDRPYFLETVRFADELRLPYIHLGRFFKKKDLKKMYADLASLRTIGVVGSSAGGWENALNEMAGARIPFFMNKRLNSYGPISEKIGIQTFGVDFDALEKRIHGHSRMESQIPHGVEDDGLASLFEWIDIALNETTRKQIVDDNYRQASQHLSSHAMAVRLWRLIWMLYAKHTLTMV